MEEPGSFIGHNENPLRNEGPRWKNLVLLSDIMKTPSGMRGFNQNQLLIIMKKAKKLS
jgi:hypothetical protein